MQSAFLYDELRGSYVGGGMDTGIAQVRFNLRVTHEVGVFSNTLNTESKESWHFISGSGGTVPSTTDFCEDVFVACPAEERRECISYILRRLRELKVAGQLISCTPPRGFCFGWSNRTKDYTQITRDLRRDKLAPAPSQKQKRLPSG